MHLSTLNLRSFYLQQMAIIRETCNSSKQRRWDCGVLSPKRDICIIAHSPKSLGSLQKTGRKECAREREYIATLKQGPLYAEDSCSCELTAVVIACTRSVQMQDPT